MKLSDITHCWFCETELSIQNNGTDFILCPDIHNHYFYCHGNELITFAQFHGELILDIFLIDRENYQYYLEDNRSFIDKFPSKQTYLNLIDRYKFLKAFK